MTSKRNLSVVTLMSTFKLMTNVAMVMLFATTILTSCSGESVNYHASSASNLLGSIEETNGLGWAEIDVVANATDANNNALSAAASVRYEAKKEVMVENEEELGLPVVLTANANGSIATGDGNVINRTESHSASKGVALNIAGPDLSKGGTLGERTESGDTIRQEVIANLIDEAFATAASLPEGFTKEWSGSKTSPVKYYRVFVKKAAPAEVNYRLRPEFVEVDGGYVYFNIYAEKSVDGGSEWTTMDKYVDFVAMRYGTWRPNVAAQVVSTFEFTTNDTAEPMGVDAPRTELGESQRWSAINTEKMAYHFAADFAAPADAEGNTVRTIAGEVASWLYGARYNNPETGKVMELNFTGEVKTTVNKVDETTGIYTRTVSYICNGQVVDTQTGTVQLTIG